MGARRVADVPIQVRIFALKVDGILTDPSACLCIIPAIEVVLEAGRLVEGSAREPEQVVYGGTLRDEVPECVVHAVGSDGGLAGGGVVLGEVADGAEVVSQSPQNVSLDEQIAHLLVGQDLVDGVPPKVAVGELGISLRIIVKLEDDLVSVGA